MQRRRVFIVWRRAHRPLDDLDYVCVRQAFKDMYSVASSRKNAGQNLHSPTQAEQRPVQFK